MIGMLHRAKAAALVILSVALLAGCRGDEVLIPNSEEPFLNLVLNQRTVSERVGRSGQFAFLLTSGSPAEPARFRCAEHFTMRPTGTTAQFRWRALACSGEVGGYPAVSFNDANHYLPDPTTAEGLGAEAIQPGGAYELLIETGGRTIRGSVRVPVSFSASASEHNGRRMAVWPRVVGAAGYQIRLPDERLVTQTDTSFTVPDEVLRGEQIEIRALDPNLWRYVTEDQLHRSGIDGGFGVFGAISTARLTF